MLLPPRLCLRGVFVRRPNGATEAMLTTFDISNSRVTVGVVQGEELRAYFTVAEDVRRTDAEYGQKLAG